MGRPKPGREQEDHHTPVVGVPTAPPVRSPPPSAPQNPPVTQGSPYHQQRSPQYVQTNAVYPPPPPPPAMNLHVGAPWSSGLFDCSRDDNNTIVTAFTPCVTYGQIVEILDEGQTTCTMGSVLYLLLAPFLCSCWILSHGHREKLRRKYDLVEAPAEDWVVHLFCPCCALCQEYRELKSRGIDPSLGYMGNLALKQHYETATQPPNGQRMGM